MEHFRAPLRRGLENLLDDLVELVTSLPDGERKDSLNSDINRLDDLLLALGEAQ